MRRAAIRSPTRTRHDHETPRRAEAAPRVEVAHPDDPFERDARRTAARVLGDAPAHAAPRCPCGGTCPRCRAGGGAGARAGEDHSPDHGEERHSHDRAAERGGGLPVGVRPGWESLVTAAGAGGRPLGGGERAFFEPRFGRDLAGVRIHDDGRADAAARAVGARAYTLGDHVVFRAGAYRPHTTSGRRLLAHELAHVTRPSGRLQRDFAVEPVTTEFDAVPLTDDEVREAIRYNSLRYFDEDEIELIRDVLGVSPRPAVIDRDFALAVARYQQQFGERPDGKLGPDSAAVLTRELTAENLASDAEQMAIRGNATERANNVDSGGKTDIFDAILDHGNARLTLLLRVQFNFVPGNGGAWPSVAAQRDFRDRFVSLVRDRWSFKLLMKRRRPSADYLRYYATRVQVVPTSRNPHYTADVGYATSFTRSAVDRPANTADFDVLDVDPIEYERGGRTYRRTTVEHEFGHMLGLRHIACNSGDEACYGGTHGERRNIMGFGGAVTPENAQPFLDAMRAITGMDWDAETLRRRI